MRPPRRRQLPFHRTPPTNPLSGRNSALGINGREAVVPVAVGTVLVYHIGQGGSHASRYRVSPTTPHHPTVSTPTTPRPGESRGASATPHVGRFSWARCSPCWGLPRSRGACRGEFPGAGSRWRFSWARLSRSRRPGRWAVPWIPPGRGGRFSRTRRSDL